MRNRLNIGEVITAVYSEGPGGPPPKPGLDIMPEILPKVKPLHAVIPVDLFLPAARPIPNGSSRLSGRCSRENPVELPVEMRNFG